MRTMKQGTSLTLNSRPQSVALLEDYLSELTKEYNIPEETYPNILISLTEAVNNAIHHGNCCDESKQVKVHVVRLHKAGDDSLVFRVEDQGPGFDPHNVPNPTLEENVGKSGGRGLYLMKALSQDLQYHDNGRAVEIHFNLC